MEVLQIVYYTFLLKIFEFLETIFFVLRKKNSQISNLHVYHHVSTAGLVYIGANYYGCELSRFSLMLNSFVHVVMYSYYILAQYKITLSIAQVIKRYITVIQMVQFSLFLFHAGYLLSHGCDPPIGLLITYISNVLLIFYMFYEFYQNAYHAKKIRQDKVE